MPTFSIVIPAYNAEAYLPQCLDSIFEQDYYNYEVIVIDDGSTDGTAALLSTYAEKHHNLHILSQENHGMATARNRGLDIAQGEYIIFVDSDDWLADHALATLVTAFDGTDIVGFGARIAYEGGASAATQDEAAAPTATMTGWDYFCQERLTPRAVHFVCIWQRAYRRAFLEGEGLRFEEGLRRAEDDLFTTMAMLHAKSVKTISDIIYTYRVRQGSITRSADPRLDADSRRVQQMLVDTFMPMQGVDKRVIYQVLASNYITRLSAKGERLTSSEWRQFHEVCVTSRHRFLYRLARLHPTLLRIYLKRNTL